MAPYDAAVDHGGTAMTNEPESAPLPGPEQPPVTADELSAMFRLDGRVALVTGASSGLGERFSRVLHAAGAHVVVAARRMERLEGLAGDLGERVTPVCADLTREDDRSGLVRRALGVLGRIDVLVNNAGHSAPVPAEDETLDHFVDTLDINLLAPFHLAQLVGRSMLAEGRGSIVNVASVLGLVASAPMKDASYCASKGGLVNLTRQLGCEWGRKGVRVNALAPGWFPSEMTQAEMFDDDSGRRFIERNTPMGRAGESWELDGALLFLAGDASSYVTGQVLAIDGGWVAR
jgi:NAD(P)-dependent dehydrogenase (short-subunit alcohol dehydrogenase family)